MSSDPRPLPFIDEKTGARFQNSYSLGSSCWIWKGRKRKTGYGRFFTKGREVLAHRVAYLIAFGRDPGAMHVCHRCDNPSCVRPDHLFLGTTQDNSRDRLIKGRSHRWDGSRLGEGNPRAKLTKETVALIRANSSISNYALGRQFGVTEATIRDIKTLRSWRDA